MYPSLSFTYINLFTMVNEARGAKDTLGCSFGEVFLGADEELSDRGSPRVIVYGYDGLPMQPVAPPSLDYVSGPEHPPSPDYVPGPEHPPSPVEVSYVPEPDHSPTALSPGYVADSNPEEDPEEDHADYLADGGDGDDEPSDDDDDDDDIEDEDEEPFEDEDNDEEEEHLAPADSSAIPIVDPTRLCRARKTVRLEPPMSPSMEARIAEYVAAPAPPSLLSPWLPPLPQIPSPPLLPLPSSLHLPPPIPTSLPLPSSPLPQLPVLLFIPPPVDRREDIPEAELPPRKRLCPTAPTLRYEVGESLTVTPRPTGGHRADYRFIGTIGAENRDAESGGRSAMALGCWIDPQSVEEVAPTTLEGVNAIVTKLAAVQEQDTHDIYAFHYETARLLDREPLVSREAWAHSVGLSLAVHYELQGYRTHTQMQDYRIASQESLMTTLIAQNNMPPRRSSATARVAAATRAAAAATPMTADVVEKLIEARVYAALANHETL
ncbi:hypothetical protein Tco_0237274 [Tanacetum coccineum]